MITPTFYYFGCIGTTGHYLWRNPSRNLYDFNLTPWGTKVDTRLCAPEDPWQKEGQPQGKALITHKDGWTAMAFWDRSVDKRSNSNSVFLASGIYTFDQMVEFAKIFFPKVWSRFPFEVTEIKKESA